MKLFFASDHAGLNLRRALMDHAASLGHEIADLGPESTESVDYPDFAHPVGKSIQENKVDLAIVICGSGNGVNMVVNKYTKVRSALCWNTELAALARSHNNANILAIPARFDSEEVAIETVNTFLTTPFEGGRHQNRVEKI